MGWFRAWRSRSSVKVNYRASTPGYIAWWLGLLLLHCINFGYYVGVAKLYTSFKLSYTYDQLRALSIGISHIEYPKISAIHATIAAIHAVFILLMVGSSMYARKLVFQPDTRQLVRMITQNDKVRSVVSLFVGSQPRVPFAPPRSANGDDSNKRRTSSAHRLSESIGRTGSKIFARDGLLGVESVYFDHVLLLRELVETSLQTYQVYRMSCLLPRLWLIRFYVAMLVANCWAIPFLHRYYRDRETKRRMMCLLCDAVLDMLSSIGVSLIIFATYVPQYNDPISHDFPFTNWFNDQWLANMQQEFQMMLVASWGDMGSRLAFALGLLQCMEAIKDMLTPPLPIMSNSKEHKNSSLPNPASQAAAFVRRVVLPVVLPVGCPQPDEKLGRPPASSTAATETTPVETLKSAPITEMTLAPEPVADAISPSLGQAREPITTSLRDRAIHIVIHIVGPGLFVLWGCAILAVHLTSETHHSENACPLRLKPWFSSRPGCSVIEVDCYNIQSNGHDQTMTSALDAFDPQRAARIVFSHCPELVLTPKIKQFRNIAGLKIYNSTVVAWGDDAAITGSDHPAIRSLFLIRTFFPTGELPLGVLSNDFPPLMIGVTLCITNVHTLPDFLDTKWTKGIQVAFEFSAFTQIPDVLLRLQPSMVSMAGCPITSVPPELFEIPAIQYIVLGLTRIQELPRNVTHMGSLVRAVLLPSTNITTFWSWMDHYVDYSMQFANKLFNACGTPYCRELEAIVAGKRSGFSVAPASNLARVMDVSTPEKLAYVQRAVDCTPTSPSFFPLPLEDANHGLHQ